MNTIDALAGSDITKYEAVLDMDAETVYVKLSMMSESKRFMQEFNAILTNKE